MNSKHLFMGAFLIAIASISWHEVKDCRQLPWPPRLIFAGLVFGLLDLFSIVNEELAGVVAIGFVLATLVNGGWVKECEHEGTGQPHTAAFITTEAATEQMATSAATNVPPQATQVV